jgi:peptide deformylase
MSLLPLHLLGSPVLRQRSAEVGTIDDETRKFIDDLFETMAAAKGVGLATNQVGVARRIAVIDADGDRLVLINPVILEGEDRDTAEEGCLSVPDIYAEVTRPARIPDAATNREGNR